MKYSLNVAVTIALGLALYTPTLPARADGLQATVFAPGVISSSAHEGPFAFTPDGQTIYFTRFTAGMTAPKFFVSHLTEDRWSEPCEAGMPQGITASPLCISPDGQRLYFTHARDANGRPRLWVAEKNGEGWTNSQSLGGVFAKWDADQVSPSVTSSQGIHKPEAMTVG